MPKKKADEEAEGSEETRNESSKKNPTPAKTLDELVLNYKIGKYSVIPLISLWAKELRKREEHRHLTPNEILELAMKEVLDGSVGWGELKKALANDAAAESKGPLALGEPRSKKEK